MSRGRSPYWSRFRFAVLSAISMTQSTASSAIITISASRQPTGRLSSTAFDVRAVGLRTSEGGPGHDFRLIIATLQRRTLRLIASYPVAAPGYGSASTPDCTWPSLLVARTRIACIPTASGVQL